MTEQEQIDREVLLSESALRRLYSEELREEAQNAWERAEAMADTSRYLATPQEERPA